VEPVFQSSINTYMKKILNQYFWIFVILLILSYTISLFPDKKNRLEFIEDRIKAVEERKKILTQTERELEKLATERDWEQVDKDKTK